MISFKEGIPKSTLCEEKSPSAARTDTSATRRLKSLVGYSGPEDGAETSALLISVSTPEDLSCRATHVYQIQGDTIGIGLVYTDKAETPIKTMYINIKIRSHPLAILSM